MPFFYSSSGADAEDEGERVDGEQEEKASALIICIRIDLQFKYVAAEAGTREDTSTALGFLFFFFDNNKIDRNVFCGWLVFGTGARKSRSQRSHTHTHALADCAKTLHETITCV